MDYLIKSTLQNLVSSLPSPLDDLIYFKLQLYFGGLKNYTPSKRFKASKYFIDILSSLNKTPRNLRILEIGSGIIPVIPIALWLNGAKCVYATDLNCYLSPFLLARCLTWIKSNRDILIELFPDIHVDRLNLICKSYSISDLNSAIAFLKTIDIYYISPCDARHLSFDDNCFDCILSYTVLEHIQTDFICDIFIELKRVLSPGGCFIHNIDFSDHFSHMDKSISPINFLRFNKFQYRLLAGNKFMYMNRLRLDDFDQIFDNLSLNSVYFESIESDILKYQIQHDSLGFSIHSDFADKSISTLSCLEAWYALSCS